MQSENKYIGDDKFKKFLEHYDCPTRIGVVKMRFAGAICSPNLELRPADVISSFWEKEKQPRLETKKEAELFFKFFMGLWDELFEKIRQNHLKLPQTANESIKDSGARCLERYEEVEYGFLEGFWGGRKDLNLPAYIVEIIDSLSETADVYGVLAKRIENGEYGSGIRKTVLHTDKVVERAIAFIIENTVLPRIKNLKRTTN